MECAIALTEPLWSGPTRSTTYGIKVYLSNSLYQKSNRPSSTKFVSGRLITFIMVFIIVFIILKKKKKKKKKKKIKKKQEARSGINGFVLLRHPALSIMR